MLFTIIIPTYNRARELGINLSCLLPQVRQHREKVNVYISDNASTDGTRNIAEQYLKEYSDILIYFRHPENVGWIQNFFHAANHVDAQYICLLGDDDYVRHDYLDTVFELIEKYPDAGLINYNMLSVTDNYKIIGTRDSHAYENHIGYYQNGGDFLKKHMRAPSLISSNVFLREPFLEASRKINKEEYPGYDWYMAMALSIIDKPCVYYDFPLVCATAPSQVRWIADAPWYHIYGFGHTFRELDKYSPGVEDAWKNDYYKYPLHYNNILEIISANRSIYKERLNTLLEYAPNRQYAMKLRLYISLPKKTADFLLRNGQRFNTLLIRLRLKR